MVNADMTSIEDARLVHDKALKYQFYVVILSIVLPFSSKNIL